MRRTLLISICAVLQFATSLSAGASTTSATAPNATPIKTLLDTTDALTRMPPLLGQDPAILHYRLGAGGDAIEGFVKPAEPFIVRGVIATGQTVVAVPFLTGGSIGAKQTLLWASDGGAMRFVGYVPSSNGHMDVRIEHGLIAVDTPLVFDGSEACAPYHHVDYDTLHGIKLVTVRSTSYKDACAH